MAVENMTERTQHRPLIGMTVGAVLEYTGLPYFGLNGQYVAALKAAGADVVLIDPQFAPKVLAKSEAQEMVEEIAAIAKAQNVELFRRFAIMRHWREVEGLPFDSFVSPDGLHMNDWSYSCLAKALSVAIAEASSRPTATAVAHRPK